MRGRIIKAMVGLGIRDEGLGMRDEGLGMKDERLMIKDSSFGSWLIA